MTENSEEKKVNEGNEETNLLSTMFGWGSTAHGELGLGGIEEEQICIPRPLDWTQASCVTYAACGDSHSLLLTKSGQLYSCGNNDYGQLGHNLPRKRPQLVTDLDAYNINKAACGAFHSIAITNYGQIFSWGSDLNGQLGHGRANHVQYIPKIIKSLAIYNIVQVQCGLRHTLALTNSGELYAWGANNFGQLGLGSVYENELKPTLVKSLAGLPIVLIACGGNHSFAISKSGAVYGWGKNNCGQLGLNDVENKMYPTQLRTMRNIRVRYIACGEDFSVFLTLDGGVFTCGQGQYGQLGHGNISDEILPRKVMELMGSVITQVTCGKRHTLAFVPSRSRVYGFGLGCAGQLGSKKLTKVTTPQLVLGPWIEETNSEVKKKNEFLINRIFSGGDHCFVTLFTRALYKVESYDCRKYEKSTQILTVDIDKLNVLGTLTNNDMVDQDLLTYIEVVFHSLACLNGSFLLNNYDHYCCNSNNHGVDLALAQSAFSIISRFENDTVKSLIRTCILEGLLNNLMTSPPDVEALRIYLILPLYHEFNNPKNYMVLHRPFSAAILNLTVQARRVFETWLRKSPNDYFENFINIFKEVVLYILRNQNNIQFNRTMQNDIGLYNALNLLERLHCVNRSVEGFKIPYVSFTIPELIECYDVKTDYIYWLSDKKGDGFYLCNYPFLFDAHAKTQLLEMDQSLQMHTAINESAARMLTRFAFFPQYLDNLSQFVTLNVSRENIVNDTLQELAQYDCKDLKKPLKVKFRGEEAEDAGGVRKEFFLLLIREILDPKYGMFKEDEDTHMYWFSEDSFEDSVMYQLIGLICGLAIYNFTIIPLPFPLALYKKILKEPVGLVDLRDLSPTLANSLQQILEYDGEDFTEVFDLNFAIERNVFGEIKTIELKNGGSNISVTQDTKKEFVDLYVDFILNKSCEQHFDYFNRGFMKVCGSRVLTLFQSHELMAVVIGNEDYDWPMFEHYAQYKGYVVTDQVIRWFWDVFHNDLSIDDKKKFLLFLTGSDRIPLKGIKAVTITIQATDDDRFLPAAHTCFNLLDLPRYKSREDLKTKLLQAIQYYKGFSLV